MIELLYWFSWAMWMLIAGGAVVLLLGWRSRRIDNHPICSRCGYDLLGSPADRDRCPECGADLTRPGAVRVGNRVHHRGLIVTAISIMVLPYGASWLLDEQRQAIHRRPAEFMAAVEGGDLTTVDRMVRRYPDFARGQFPPYYSPDQEPLHAAVSRGHPHVVARLLTAGANPNGGPPNDETPLHRAVEHGRFLCAQLLLDHGADPNLKDRYGHTPLAHAVARDHMELLNLLLAHGADPGITGRGAPPVHSAAELRRREMVELLLDAGVPVGVCDAEGRTLLHIALENRDFALAGLLLERGADLTRRDNQGRVPGSPTVARPGTATGLDFWWNLAEGAVRAGETREIEAMLRAAPEVLTFQRDYTPGTLLHQAAVAFSLDERRIDVLRLLLAHAPNVNVPDSNGDTPLQVAVLAGTTQSGVWRLLLDGGADVQTRNKAGQTPLHRAAEFDAADAAEALIVRSAEVNARDRYGSPPLHYALLVQPPHERLVRILYEQGAELDFYAAVAMGDAETVRGFLGANPELIRAVDNLPGYTALHIAAMRGDRAMAELLLGHGADPNATQASRPMDRRSQGWTPLQMALRYRRLELTRLLLERGASANPPHGEPPLHMAATWEPQLVELLLKHGANADAVHARETALDAAIRQKKQVIIDLLAARGAARSAGESDVTALLP